jgi:tetratricopeptide (TPR) repeat protein
MARQPPEPLDAACPEGLRAIVGKLLAPAAAARYDSAQAIREDLERYAAGQPTQAQTEGWPHAGDDQPATRRTRMPAAVATPAPGRATRRGSRAAVPVWVRAGLALMVLGTLLTIASLMANEVRVYRGAGRAVGAVRSAEIGDLPGLWQRYDALSETSYLRVGVRGLARELADRTQTLADRVIRNYSTGVSGIREAQWEQARSPLVRAARVDPDDARLRAALRFIEGHLHRIDGDGHAERKQLVLAQREYAEALTAFREAAELRPQWPEPFLGLARTFIASLADLEKGEDAIAQAQRLGRVSLEPETRMLAVGYRKRGDTFAANAAKLAATPQEEPFLTRARESYQRSLELYASLPAGSPAEAIRAAQSGLNRVEERLDHLVSTPVAEDTNANTAVVNLVPQ